MAVDKKHNRILGRFKLLKARFKLLKARFKRPRLKINIKQHHFKPGSLKQMSGLVIIFFLSLFVFNSCEEKTDWDLVTTKSNTIVVDAILTNEYKHQVIHLTLPYSTPNDTAIAVSGAEVSVWANNDKIDFIEVEDNPGYYLTENPGAAVVNTLYQLRIGYESAIFEAQTYMIPVANPNSPSFAYVPEKGLYRINWNNGQYSQTEEAMFEADVRWGHLLAQPIEDSTTRAKIRYYTLNTIDVSYVIFPQDKEEVLFPAGAIVVFKKYSIIPEYGDFLRALLAETEWQGSLFEEARGNLPTNISNGGLGYFSACSVLIDTLVVH